MGSASNPAYFAAWQRAKQQRWRQVGACVTCGLPCTTNPQTQKPFARCFEHRQQCSTYSKRYHRRHGRPDKQAI